MINIFFRLAGFLTALLTACSATPINEEEAGNVISFVTCPVYRDTDQGPKSGCWLATDPATGLSYDVGFARSKPFMGHEVLVDGIVDSSEANLCGGIVLRPARTAVLPTRCDEFIIPAEGHTGRRFQLPKEVLQPTDVPRKLPPPPYENREYHIYFSMYSDFPIYQYSEILLEKISLYIRASRPKKVAITGFADTKGLTVSGHWLHEDITMAQRRADKVAEALRRLLVPANIIEEKFSGHPDTIDGGDEGLLQASKRRVTVSVEL